MMPEQQVELMRETIARTIYVLLKKEGLEKSTDHLAVQAALDRIAASINDEMPANNSFGKWIFTAKDGEIVIDCSARRDAAG